MLEIVIHPNSDKRIYLSVKTSNVMIVDDERIMRQLLREIMERWGYNAITASDTDEGLKIFEAIRKAGFSVDLILMDIKMPPGKRDGFSLSDYLKSNYQYENIIFMTGSTGEEEVRRQLDTRGRPYFGKPFDLKELKEAVDFSLKEAAMA